MTDLYTHYSCRPYWATAVPDEDQINIGERFKTGAIAPASGVYRYVEHCEEHKHSLACTPSIVEMDIKLSRGDKVPPLRSCGESVIWRLVSLT